MATPAPLRSGVIVWLTDRRPVPSLDDDATVQAQVGRRALAPISPTTPHE